MSPRTAEEYQRIRDERKEKIIAAAVKVFAHKGLAATKIADIAAAAGASHGLVYHYFTTKEQLFATLVERAMQGSLMVTQGALERPGTPWDRIRWMASQMLMGVRDEPEYFMITLEAYTNEVVPEEVREVAWEQAEMSRNAIRQLITEGQAAGQVVAGDPDELATLFGACIQGLAVTAAFLTPFMPGFPEVDSLLRLLRAC